MNIIYICKYLGRMLIIKLMWCLSEKHPLVFFPFCAFLSWFNVVSHLVDFISRSDMTPFHSVKQWPLALNSRLSDYVKRVIFAPKGRTLFVQDVQHFPAAVMNCSSQLDQPHSVKAPLQMSFYKKKLYQLFVLKCYVCVIRSQVDRLTSLIGSF